MEYPPFPRTSTLGKIPTKFPIGASVRNRSCLPPRPVWNVQVGGIPPPCWAAYSIRDFSPSGSPSALGLSKSIAIIPCPIATPILKSRFVSPSHHFKAAEGSVVATSRQFITAASLPLIFNWNTGRPKAAYSAATGPKLKGSLLKVSSPSFFFASLAPYHSSRICSTGTFRAFAILPMVAGRKFRPVMALFSVGRGRLAAIAKSLESIQALAIANSSFFLFTFNLFHPF